MEINYNGIRLKLTDEQIEEIKKQEDKERLKKAEYKKLFEDLVLTQIDFDHPKTNLTEYPGMLFWFTESGAIVCTYNFKTHDFMISNAATWNELTDDLEMNEEKIQALWDIIDPLFGNNIMSIGVMTSEERDEYLQYFYHF